MKKTLLAMSLIIAGFAANASVINMADYNNVIYVSADGSDSGDGSAENPFATIEKAVDVAGVDGDAIKISGGRFTLSGNGLTNDGKNVDFYGSNGETELFIDGSATTARDVFFYSGQGYSEIHGISFLRDSNNRSTNYMNAFFGYGNVKGEFHNTVFKAINHGAIGLTYWNHGNMTNLSIYNSVFDVEHDFVSSYSGSGIKIYDSVSNHAFKQPDGLNQYINSYSDVEMDENYRIVNDPDGTYANIGVYSGDGNWATSVPVSSSIAILSLGLLGLSRRKKK